MAGSTMSMVCWPGARIVVRPALRLGSLGEKAP